MKMGLGGWKRELKLPALLYAHDLAVCGEFIEKLRVMISRFVEICKERGLPVNEDKSKVTVLGGEKGSMSEVTIDGK